VISCGEGVTMVKRFVHLKKNVMMIIATLASCTQEKKEGSKTVGGGGTPKNKIQTKTKNKSKRVCSDGKEVLFT
jgi:hypothetical protein